MTAPITDEAWQKIIDGLEGVTPGPWAAKETPDYCEVRAHGNSIALVQGSYETGPHIARLSPDTILAIDARMKALEAENKRLRDALEFYANPEVYKPHPHGLAFDRPDKSYAARAALEASQ